MNVIAIETMSCRIKQGVSQEEFLKTCFQIKNELISKQQGFIARHITIDKNGAILMFIHWESIRDMENSQAKLAKENLVLTFVSLMEQESIATSNLTIIQ